jgi:hypothetical protein
VLSLQSLKLTDTQVDRCTDEYMLWYNYTRNKPKLTRKSEDAVNSDHVLKFMFDCEAGHISAAVQASMRDKSYDVQVRRLLILCISSSLRNKSLE